MKVLMPNLPPAFSRFNPRVRFARNRLDGMPPRRAFDELALEAALRHERNRAEGTGITNGYVEAFFTNTADFTAVANTTAETSLLAGNKQPIIPATHFLQNAGRGVRIWAKGILNTTSTPTLAFQARLGATAGTSYLAGTSVGVSAAITTQAAVSNRFWELRLDLICNTQGIGTGNTILSGAGYVMSPGGFTSPFIFPLEPTTPDTATWTSTIDGAVTQFVNLSVAWSAANASNSITCKQCYVEAFGP